MEVPLKCRQPHVKQKDRLANTSGTVNVSRVVEKNCMPTIQTWSRQLIHKGSVKLFCKNVHLLKKFGAVISRKLELSVIRSIVYSSNVEDSRLGRRLPSSSG